MENYTAIILEDEELPRLSLKTKLETYHPDIQIVDMCENCEDALRSILRHKPQLLFLDIQLPGKNSLWLIEQLEKIMKLPLIIFTTAYTDSEYMIKAIKISAIDYLNKPVNLIELSQALEKMRKRIQDEHMLRNDTRQYTFKTFNSQMIVNQKDIVYIEADGNYSQLYLAYGKKELVFERLGEIEQRLDHQFLRAGRSLVINKEYLHKLNSKDCSCELLALNKIYHLTISKGAFDILKEDFQD